ncbi:MAG: fibrobacter succinogenes major paralogous domain-containing protein [Chitinophagaceae bacterium]
MRKILLPLMAILLFVSCQKETKTNVEKEKITIPSVTICKQVWMAKNLDVSNYRNGDVIPQVTDAAAWAGLTTGAWCYYENNGANGTTYGKLYNWYAVNDARGLAPAGWHVPSDAEWTTLTDCLGGDRVAGGKMKETGTTHWQTPNTGADNSSGFTGLPGGNRFFFGPFNFIGLFGFWWSSTEVNTRFVWNRYLLYNGADAFRGTDGKANGFSVRCVRD